MNKPVAKFRAEQITCALWENEMVLPTGGTKTMLNATFERRYKDKNDQWKSSSSFGRNDIPLVRYCLDKAFAHMVEERSVKGVEEEVIQ
jgi:hypothetical protein